MGGYRPLKITGMTTGLVQEREEFILPNDAYPVLENAYVWRERILRKRGFELLGRLQRNLTGIALGNTDGGGNLTANLKAIVPLETNATIVPTTVHLTVGGGNFFDSDGDGNLIRLGVSSGTINYATGDLNFSNASFPNLATKIDFSYNPNLPVMGLRTRELNDINDEQLVAFDQTYAYIFSGTSWTEFIPFTTWTGNDSDFFWSTNYWVDSNNNKLFWVTNFNQNPGDPIRYTDGVTWTNFAPQINSAGTQFLNQCLAILPFRGRLLVFNTWEGPNLAGSDQFPQRIRWAAIGNPIPNGTYQPWVDDVRGQGGFLDIPTSEDIVSVGFVRDNLVVYCERSTWQLRYTGRSIAPFQIEKVNSELGAESTFSAVQFDTSLVGIGDKGIVECDSYKSDRIDIKIPDLVFQFNNDNNGPKRIHGIRDFFRRLAYWTYPFKPDDESSNIFPNRLLVYNYENDSWGIFTDSLTTLGTYQPPSSPTWASSKVKWVRQNEPWSSRPSLFPSIVGGNQQGFVEYLDSQVQGDVSLYIKNITGNTTTPTVINSPNHNLQTGQVIQIQDIPTGTPFDNLNDQIFGVVVVDIDNLELWIYDPNTGDFDEPQVDPPDTYIGGGQILVRDGFSITSKKFNFLDDGENIQLGYIDILMNNTTNGEITLNVYADYNDSQPINTSPENVIPSTNQPDLFFNSVVPTSVEIDRGSTKNWQRVFCPSRAAFLTIEWTLSNAQLISDAQESDVQIDAQILWVRRAGKQLPIGI
jgi:hypothetical protein